MSPIWVVTLLACIGFVFAVCMALWFYFRGLDHGRKEERISPVYVAREDSKEVVYWRLRAAGGWREATRWQAKHSQVKHENNQLRRRLNGGRKPHQKP